jgi:hypothetical protein
MRSWTDRPLEQRTLLNPAFVTTLVVEMANGYFSEAGKPMPYVLPFVGVSLVLHEPTRKILPTITTSMYAWLQQEPQARIHIPELATQCVSVTREALRFGARLGALTISVDGSITGVELGRAGRGSQTDDLKECRHKAHFVGRWLARAGDPGTILSSWGLTI